MRGQKRVEEEEVNEREKRWVGGTRVDGGRIGE